MSPVSTGDLRRDRPARVDEGLERAEALAAADLDRADLGDRVVDPVAARRLEVEHAERDVGERRAEVVEAALDRSPQPRACMTPRTPVRVKTSVRCGAARASARRCSGDGRVRARPSRRRGDLHGRHDGPPVGGRGARRARRGHRWRARRPAPWLPRGHRRRRPGRRPPPGVRGGRRRARDRRASSSSATTTRAWPATRRTRRRARSAGPPRRGGGPAGRDPARRRAPPPSSATTTTASTGTPTTSRSRGVARAAAADGRRADGVRGDGRP